MGIRVGIVISFFISVLGAIQGAFAQGVPNQGPPSHQVFYNIFKQFIEVEKSVLNDPARLHIDEYDRCNCTLKGAEEGTLPFEDSKSCGKYRGWLQKGLEKLPEEFLRYDLSNNHVGIPRACVNYALQKVVRLGRSQVAYCPNPNGGIQRGGNAPACITKEYVNAAYNAYNDAFQCIGENPKLMVPKIANESGFHMEALGLGMDAGIGQLTGPAIAVINHSLKRFEALARANPSSECQRILKIPGVFTPVPSPGVPSAARCQLIAPPGGPVKNTIFSAVLNRINREYVNDTIAEEGWLKKLDQLGIRDPNHEKLSDFITLLSYNSGSGGAISAMKVYVRNKYNNLKGCYTTQCRKDLCENYTVDGFIHLDDKKITTKSCINRPPSFITDQLNYCVQDTLNHMREAPSACTRYQLKREDFSFKFTKRSPTPPANQRNHIFWTFAEKFGAKSPPAKYLWALTVKKKQLDDVFGEDTCTQKDFLEL